MYQYIASAAQQSAKPVTRNFPVSFEYFVRRRHIDYRQVEPQHLPVMYFFTEVFQSKKN